MSDIASNNLQVNKNLLSNRTLSFNKFNSLYKDIYNTTLDPDWLSWLVGFAEGDGYLGINEGKPVFVLTQKEAIILYEIRDILKLHLDM